MSITSSQIMSRKRALQVCRYTPILHFHEELFPKTQSLNLAWRLESHLFGMALIAFGKRALHIYVIYITQICIYIYVYVTQIYHIDISHRYIYVIYTIICSHVCSNMHILINPFIAYNKLCNITHPPTTHHHLPLWLGQAGTNMHLTGPLAVFWVLFLCVCVVLVLGGGVNRGVRD